MTVYEQHTFINQTMSLLQKTKIVMCHILNKRVLKFDDVKSFSGLIIYMSLVKLQK